MHCYIHTQKDAVGTCTHCGKFICDECNTQIESKNYCKNCVDKLFTENNKTIDKLQEKSSTSQAPMVFMNAGGGSSSSSSSSGASRNAPPYPRNGVLAHILLLLFTAGVGNVIYFFYIKSKQNAWVKMYR